MSPFPAFRLRLRRGRGLAAVTGPVLRPADPGYAAELTAFNTAFTLRPGLVVGAACEADVVAAVAQAAADGLPVAVKGAGHGVAADVGAPVLVSTRRLDTVTVDPRAAVARVGAGATWAQVVAATVPHGLVPLTSSSTRVGVAGFTLGGGMSPIGRRHGFAADHVRRLRLVTAEGRVHEIDHDRAPELFWALRGAGKVGFGVVTELEVGLFPLPRLHRGSLVFPGDAAPAVLHAWREWAPTLPDEVGTSVALVHGRAGRPVVHLRYAHAGGPGADPARAGGLLAPMRAVATPLRAQLAEIPYSAIDSVHRDLTAPLPYHEGGAALRELPAAGPDADPPLILTELRWMGGALTRPAGVPNSVAGRDAACSLFALAPARRHAADPPGGAPDAVAAVLAAAGPWSLGAALPNFAGAARPDALWSRSDRARLRLLQRAVDPDRMFAAAGPPPHRV